MSLPTERDRVEAIRQILIQLYRLVDKGLPETHIRRIERESIFFLFENVGMEKLHKDRPHSKAARNILRTLPGEFKKSVTYDHTIPLATLRQKLKDATVSREAMYEFLMRFIKGVVITRAEDKRLNKLGLRKALPPEALCHDMMARYRSAGIDFESDDERMLCQNLELT
jgi:hypothetical protein